MRQPGQDPRAVIQARFPDAPEVPHSSTVVASPGKTSFSHRNPCMLADSYRFLIISILLDQDHDRQLVEATGAIAASCPKRFHFTPLLFVSKNFLA
jgi:hypothetical protein